MSTASDPRPALARDRAPPPLVWRSWPLRDRWQYGLAFVAGCIAVAVMSYAVSGHALSSWLIVAALVLAAWRLWMPVTYELDARGVHQRIWRRRHLPWHVISRCRMYDEGILVLRDSDPTPWDPCQGLFIPWHHHRAEISMLVQYYLESGRIRRAGSNWRRMSTDFEVTQPRSAVSAAKPDLHSQQ